ncbi:MAG: hypothetical protein ACI36X_01810 [Bacteroidaceae bacterium]
MATITGGSNFTYSSIERVSDMTYDKKNKVLYAISTTTKASSATVKPSRLYCIEPTTGKMTTLADLQATLCGIAADANGELYCIGSNLESTYGFTLFKIKKDNGSYSVEEVMKNFTVKDASKTYTKLDMSGSRRCQSIEFGADGKLYWMARPYNFPAVNRWAVIDDFNATEVTLKGSLGNYHMVGLTFDPLVVTESLSDVTDITVNGKSIWPIQFTGTNATYTLDYGVDTSNRVVKVMVGETEKEVTVSTVMTENGQSYFTAKFTIGSIEYEIKLYVTYQIASGTKSVAIEGTLSSDKVTDLNNADNKLTVVDLTGITSVSAEAGNLNLQNPNCLVFTKPGVTLYVADGKHVNQVVYDSEAGTYTANDIQLTDGTNFRNPHAFQAKKVSYKRTFTPNKYGTFCLPYAMKVSELGLAEGEVVEELESLDAANSTITFTQLADDADLEPNKAYLIGNNATNTAKTFALDKGDTYGIEVPEVSDTIPSSTCFRANMVSFVMANDPNLYKLNSTKNQFTHSDGTAVIPAFRGYLDLNTATPLSSLRVKHITRGTGEEGGGATAIADTPAASSVWMEEGMLHVRAAEELLVPVYALDGRLVCWLHVQPNRPASVALERGTYLVAGQKVVW